MDKWCLLRGYVPRDRNPLEIIHDSISDEDDMWIQLFSKLVGNNFGDIYYIGAKENDEFMYSYNLKMNLVKSVNDIDDDYDIIFARGGYPEYPGILNQITHAFKIYYGAGRRFLPADGIKYDLIIVDSKKQYDLVKNNIKTNILQWNKPSAEIDYRRGIEIAGDILPGDDKLFDICYIANEQQARIKGIDWTYSQDWNGLKLLHLGFNSTHKHQNITSKRVLHGDIFTEIRSCKIAIFPYWNGIDSMPRALSECLYCGLPCFINKDIPCPDSHYIIKTTQTNIYGDIYDYLDEEMKSEIEVYVKDEYRKFFSQDQAARAILKYV